MIYNLRSDTDYIDWNATGTARIIQNVLNIIRTKKYEIPFNRLMGIDPDFIDDSLHKNKADIIADVMDNISTHESRVTVLNVDVASFDSDGNAVISVEIEVN